MKYCDYTIELLHTLGIHQMYKGCEYIMSGIEYIHQSDKRFIPDSEMLYAQVAKEYNATPIAVENSIRNILQRIWKSKENLDFMRVVFGEYNLDKRPCNMEAIMLMYNYIKYTMDYENQAKEGYEK